jgi:hypothetical protein
VVIGDVAITDVVIVDAIRLSSTNDVVVADAVVGDVARRRGRNRAALRSAACTVRVGSTKSTSLGVPGAVCLRHLGIPETIGAPMHSLAVAPWVADCPRIRRKV